ncbi:hypothetical protein F7725_009437 [Dissostichus mawsoni]|uniref:Uncharacterized protein n=1 Tax=Dissostichus mawsoni TaxID=36200 RepID=A0A7J5XM82_DISMA|nr:hypothetical protein F7725_009437 [Dissostichus mawsoni]
MPTTVTVTTLSLMMSSAHSQVTDDSWGMFCETTEFQRGGVSPYNTADFDNNVNASVSETNIRVTPEVERRSEAGDPEFARASRLEQVCGDARRNTDEVSRGSRVDESEQAGAGGCPVLYWRIAAKSLVFSSLNLLRRNCRILLLSI